MDSLCDRRWNDEPPNGSAILESLDKGPESMELDWKKRLDEEIEILEQTRDELKLQAHLGAAEAREVWAKLEKNWEHLESRLKRVGHATQESAEDIEEATKTLVEEIKAGYQRIRDTR